MLMISSLIQSALKEAFEASHLASASCIARAGPTSIRFQFSSSMLATAYAQSLLPTKASPDLSVRVLTADDIDLSGLIPEPFEQGRSFSQGRYFSLWHADHRPVLYLLDREGACGLVWLASGAAPHWELSRPACPLINAFLDNTPWCTLHAAAVGRGDQMLLLAGPGRVGKSTAALSCALAGWNYAGDDYVIADTSTGWIEPLYSSARLRADMGPSFPEALRTSAGPSNDDGDPRYELRLAPHLAPSALRGGQLAAVLMPRRAGAQVPRFETALRSDAFHSLFKNSMLGAPSALRTAATKLSSLVAKAPAYFVDTGCDPEAIPTAFDLFLRSR